MTDSDHYCLWIDLGVCVGYGATPLPSLYDALIYDRNATAAQEQVYRVMHLLEGLADKIKP